MKTAAALFCCIAFAFLSAGCAGASKAPALPGFTSWQGKTVYLKDAPILRGPEEMTATKPWHLDGMGMEPGIAKLKKGTPLLIEDFVVKTAGGGWVGVYVRGTITHDGKTLPVEYHIATPENPFNPSAVAEELARPSNRFWSAAPR